MKKLFFAFSALAAFVAQADMMDRPSGIKIGQRMTIRPYVSLYYTWDSNPNSDTRQGSYSSFNINPGLTLSYKADNWRIEGGAYYQYHAYTKNSPTMNESSWGENLAFTWSNSKDGGRGWSLVLRENIQKISQDDDMTTDGGRGIGRDRMQMEFAGALQRRFTDRWHADIDGSFYYIDYDNNLATYAPLYGWTRWTAGAQAGYVLSKWTDLIIAGTYQGYTQDNNDFVRSQGMEKIGNKSQGVTVQAGFGSYATEKISYRLTGGYSYFRYGDGAGNMGGFTYAVSGHWRMSDTWNMMLLASSYYQPNETDYGSYMRVDAFSWGVAHAMVRNKLTATLDLSYRHNQREYAVSTYDGADANNEDYITARLGLNYALNRFVSIFGHAEYQTAFYRGDNLDQHNYTYDYDRWRLSVGLRLTY